MSSQSVDRHYDTMLWYVYLSTRDYDTSVSVALFQGSSGEAGLLGTMGSAGKTVSPNQIQVHLKCISSCPYSNNLSTVMSLCRESKAKQEI